MREIMHNFNSSIFSLIGERFAESTKGLGIKDIKTIIETNWVVQFSFYNDDGELWHFCSTIGSMYEDLEYYRDLSIFPGCEEGVWDVQVLCNAPYQVWILADFPEFFELLTEIKNAFPYAFLYRD